MFWCRFTSKSTVRIEVVGPEPSVLTPEEAAEHLHLEFTRLYLEPPRHRPTCILPQTPLHDCFDTQHRSCSGADPSKQTLVAFAPLNLCAASPHSTCVPLSRVMRTGTFDLTPDLMPLMDEELVEHLVDSFLLRFDGRCAADRPTCTFITMNSQAVDQPLIDSCRILSCRYAKRTKEDRCCIWMSFVSISSLLISPGPHLLHPPRVETNAWHAKARTGMYKK